MVIKKDIVAADIVIAALKEVVIEFHIIEGDSHVLRKSAHFTKNAGPDKQTGARYPNHVMDAAVITEVVFLAVRKMLQLMHRSDADIGNPAVLNQIAIRIQKLHPDRARPGFLRKIQHLGKPPFRQGFHIVIQKEQVIRPGFFRSAVAHVGKIKRLRLVHIVCAEKSGCFGQGRNERFNLPSVFGGASIVHQNKFIGNPGIFSMRTHRLHDRMQTLLQQLRIVLGRDDDTDRIRGLFPRLFPMKLRQQLLLLVSSQIEIFSLVPVKKNLRQMADREMKIALRIFPRGDLFGIFSCPPSPGEARLLPCKQEKKQIGRRHLEGKPFLLPGRKFFPLL